MGKTYELKFSLECFEPEERETMELYLEDHIKVGEAFKRLGWGASEWGLAMATVFELGLRDEQPEAELRRV